MRTWRVNISMASLLLEGGSAASKASLQAPTPSPLPRLPFFSPTPIFSPFSHNAERGPRLILTLISTSWFGAISTELSMFPPIWLIKIKKKKKNSPKNNFQWSSSFACLVFFPSFSFLFLVRFSSLFFLFFYWNNNKKLRSRPPSSTDHKRTYKTSK